jgi:pimeloyl-ACP methyl ester carboxylesterase
MFRGMPTTTTFQLPQGPVRVRDEGSGPTVVFLHGLLVDGRLWRKVTPLLSERFRCVVPDLPLGSHPAAMRPDADLTPPGIARLVADLLDELDLRDVTLVGNDTGGAITQLVATRHPERVGRLVLTNCDAFEHFPPAMFRPLQWVARVPPALRLMAASMRFDALRRSPMAYGMLAKSRIPDEILDAWLRPGREDRGVAGDLVKVLRGIHPRYTLEAAERLAEFEGPALLAWAPEDRFFKRAWADRLAERLRDARVVDVPDSYTFVPEDQPVRLAELIAEFAPLDVSRPIEVG